MVLLNSGAALMAAGKVETIKDGVGMAATAIESGAAMEKLDALVAYTQENG